MGSWESFPDFGPPCLCFYLVGGKALLPVLGATKSVLGRVEATDSLQCQWLGSSSAHESHIPSLSGFLFKSQVYLQCLHLLVSEILREWSLKCWCFTLLHAFLKNQLSCIFLEAAIVVKGCEITSGLVLSCRSLTMRTNPSWVAWLWMTLKGCLVSHTLPLYFLSTSLGRSHKIWERKKSTGISKLEGSRNSFLCIPRKYKHSLHLKSSMAWC